MNSEPAPRGGALFSRLRAETSEQHAALEQLVPLMSASVSRADYVHFLSLSWAFHSSVEHELRRVDGLAGVIADLDQRWKTAWLEQDLAALGVDTAAFLQACAGGRAPFSSERHAEVPAITSIERALGVMYVLEGSTLGGQYLRRHLSEAQPEVMALASRFLDVYGSQTGSMWKTFQRQVDAVAASLDADGVVDAAREAFLVLMDWFRPLHTEEAGSAVPGARPGAEGRV